MRAQFAKTMREVGKADPRLTVLVGDIGAFGLRDFAADCPGRFMNAGIREQAMASAAAGLALTGMVPVIHSITPFVVERCFEQIKDDFGYHKLPGNVVSVGAGLDYSALGCTHHSYSDIAMMKSLPSSQVFYPGAPGEFDALFRATYAQGTINYFRIGGRNHPIAPNVVDPAQVKPGKSFVIKEGRAVTLLAAGSWVIYALRAAETLGDCELIYTPSIKPFDADALRTSVRKTGKLVIAEDHSIYGGVADEARRALENTGITYKIAALGVDREFIREYGTTDEVARHAGIDDHAIVAAVRRWS